MGETVHYRINYKNRTSYGISIDVYGVIEIQAPKGTSADAVHQLLERNWAVIQNGLKEMKERLEGPQKKAYDHGEQFLYLGRAYPIEIIQDSAVEKDYVQFQGDRLNICVKAHNDESIKQVLRRFYVQQCKAQVEKRVSLYEKRFKMKPRSIRISDSKTTWGTCDSNRKLTFNWRLAMAPPKVIDYVVIHEMCHMVHLNHDRSFWRLVGSIMPDYEDQERWLEKSSWKMTV